MPIVPMEVKPSLIISKSDVKSLSETSDSIENVTNVDSIPIPLVKTYIKLEARFILANADALTPFTHQNLMVLYSTICNGKNIPCEAPIPTLIEYYRDSDWYFCFLNVKVRLDSLLKKVVLSQRSNVMCVKKLCCNIAG
jgi:hypothetical protein